MAQEQRFPMHEQPEADKDLEKFITVFVEEIRGVLGHLVPKHREALQVEVVPKGKRLVRLCEEEDNINLPGCLGSNKETGPAKVASTWAPVVPEPAKRDVSNKDPLSALDEHKDDSRTSCNQDSVPATAISSSKSDNRWSVGSAGSKEGESWLSQDQKMTAGASARTLHQVPSIAKGSVCESERDSTLNPQTFHRARTRFQSGRQSVAGIMKKSKTWLPGLKKANTSEPSKPPPGMFADMNQMKEQIRDVLFEREYDVTQMYHTEGTWQAVARSQEFDNVTIFVIMVNIIYVAVDAEYNSSAKFGQSSTGWVICENFFCLYYAGEIAIRFLAFARKQNCLKDAWFAFDAFLAVLVVAETWVLGFLFLVLKDLDGFSSNGSILRILRLLRLTKVLRMVRVLKLMPELLVLSKGLMVAFRSVFFTLVLLLVIVYVFVIAFKQLSADTPLGEEFFYSVPGGMATLLVKATLPDFADLLIRFGSEHLFFGAMLLVFIFLASLLVLNMLIGVLCEVVSFVSSVEKEQLTVTWVRQELQKILAKFSMGTEQRTLNRNDFAVLLTIPEAVKVIQRLGVDVLGLVDFSDFFFRGTDEIVFGDFMELVLQLRGSNKATVKDVVDLRRHMILEMGELKDNVETMLNTLVKIKKGAATKDGSGSGNGNDFHFTPGSMVNTTSMKPARGATDIGLKLTGKLNGMM